MQSTSSAGNTTIYGIRDCDTVRKARAWLASKGIDHAFHDFKTDGLPGELLDHWCRALGWEVLLNRAGRTFRQLPSGDRDALDARKAAALMLAQPSMVKRPVLSRGDRLLVGFRPEAYAAFFDGR